MAAPRPRASALSVLPEAPCTLIVDYVGGTAQLAALSLASRAWAERVGGSAEWERGVARRCPATHGDRNAAFNRRTADGGFGAPVHWRAELHALMVSRLGAVLGADDQASAPWRLPNPFDLLRNKPLRNIVCRGLGGAGKTTLLYKLKCRDEPDDGCAAVDYRTMQHAGAIRRGAGRNAVGVETIEVDTVRITVVPLRVHQAMAPLLRNRYETCAGLIFVVDAAAADGAALCAAALALHAALDFGAASQGGLPLLVLANKQDVPGAAAPAVVAERLGLSELRRPWRVQGCSAERGALFNPGLMDALRWLTGEALW
jgi:hypothetical protein